MRQVYMDHSATTPVDPDVFKSTIPYYNDRFGNPSSIYSLGRDAKKAVGKAREQIASLINVSPGEIYFTSGGTEADNQAIISYMMTNQERGNHLITSAVEHHAVLDACRF
ncbi:MAG: aminotransferase class V-fold PLP-dependent enzyme, partial [Candidatus Contubernalis sp.]|nr:aminotransferase class V-fold PLP-dependent enzyme [Candidatus Contubernalis sp.]